MHYFLADGDVSAAADYNTVIADLRLSDTATCALQKKHHSMLLSDVAN